MARRSMKTQVCLMDHGFHGLGLESIHSKHGSIFVLFIIFHVIHRMSFFSWHLTWE